MNRLTCNLVSLGATDLASLGQQVDPLAVRTFERVKHHPPVFRPEGHSHIAAQPGFLPLASADARRQAKSLH